MTHDRTWARTVGARMTIGILILASGCAPAMAPKDATPKGASSPAEQDSSAAATIVKATDPEPGASVCTGYGLDGVALGMPRSQILKISPLTQVPPSSSLIRGFEKSTFALRAVRLGRADDIQIGFSPADGANEPIVHALRARIFVSKVDTWPASLFSFLGSPKRARVGEWVWWNLECRATLRLTRVSSLGGGEAQPYVLEVRRSAVPPPPSD